MYVAPMSGEAGVLEVVERSGAVAGIQAHWREAPAAGRPPVLYVHGVPTASWDWVPYLERIGTRGPESLPKRATPHATAY
jgi:pimeloyl-ACP methyl ester carboxylesterase